MAAGMNEIVLWTVALPGAVGVVGGLGARLLHKEMARESARWRGAVALALPAVALFVGYLAGEIVHRGVPGEWPVRAAWPPIAELSGSKWPLWIIGVSLLAGLVEAVRTRAGRTAWVTRWGGRVVVLGLLAWTMLRGVGEREFDGLAEIAWFMVAVSGLGLVSWLVVDAVVRRSGVRAGAGGLAIAGTGLTIAVFQSGLGPQAQVLGAMLAVCGGLAIAGGARGVWLAGPASTVFGSAMLCSAVLGHYFGYPEFGVWVWAVAMLAPAALIVGSLPGVRSLGRIKRCAIRLVAVAVIAGVVVSLVGVPAMPGGEPAPYTY